MRFFVRGVQDVKKLSGIVSGEDLALPGVPIDDGDDDDGEGNDNGGADDAKLVQGGGRDDQEDEHPTADGDSSSGPPGRNVASLAADFYTRFYDCANAIRTGDYAKWEERAATPPRPPTMEPTGASGENEDVIDDDDIGNGNDDDDDGVDNDDDSPNRRLKQMKKTKNHRGNSTIAAAEEPSPTAKAAVPESEAVAEPGLTEFESQEVLAAGKEDAINDADGDDAAHEADTDTTSQDDDDQDDEQPQEQIDEASAAEQAAKEALDKANDAAAAISSNTDDEEAVAAAAQEAANAAKKAAEASSLAKAAAAMDAIFSADGGQMTQILATCLTDPKYEIRVDRKVALPSPSPVDDDRQMEDESSPNAPDHRYATVSTTHVYLYIDGTSYYRLNLTPPFWDTSPAIQVMPQPKLYVEGQAQFLDSLFFFGIIGAFVFGMVVLLHNIGVLRIDPRLKFKSFFHPPHPGPAGGTRGGYMNATQVRESGGYRDEVDVDSDSCFTDEASDAADWTNGPDDVPPERKGGGQAHPFNNPSAIPSIFMGRVSSSQNLQVGASAAAAGDSWEGDFELSEMQGADSRQGSESRRSSSNRSGGDLDFGKPGAMGSRIDNMKAAMDDDDNDDDGAGKTPNGRGRSRSLRRDDPNRSVHSASTSSNRRRRSPVDSVPLPAQVRASRDPEFVDLPGLKSLTPVAIPQGVSRQLSRANSSVSKSKRSLSGEMLQESTVESGNENGDGGGSAHRSTPLAIV